MGGYSKRPLTRVLVTFIRGCRSTIGNDGQELIFFVNKEVRDVVGREVEVDGVVYEVREHHSTEPLYCICHSLKNGMNNGTESCKLNHQRTALDAIADAVEGQGDLQRRLADDSQDS